MRKRQCMLWGTFTNSAFQNVYRVKVTVQFSQTFSHCN
uniref:Uncharacterized protein n=1 Tax=Anguilla anguilla TaxID=7936 RepID=A0A0E9V482_ANGAN